MPVCECLDEVCCLHLHEALPWGSALLPLGLQERLVENIMETLGLQTQDIQGAHIYPAPILTHGNDPLFYFLHSLSVVPVLDRAPSLL